MKACQFVMPALIAASLFPSSPLVGSPIAIPSTRAQVFHFANGLTLIVEEDRSAPVVSVQVWCGTGSIHEADQMGSGLSHILEHMLFKGTSSRPPGEIARQVQDEGGSINAYTSFDRTVYYIDAPSSGTTAALDILCDAVTDATLPEAEYVKEQEVIRREFAMGFDDANRQSSQLMLRTVFTQSPFRHPVIGYLDVYNKLTRDDVMAYYKRRYVPNNLTFVIVGDVDALKLRDQLAKAFETKPRQALEPVYIPEEPNQLGRREAHEEFPTELSRLALAWRIPGLTHPDTPALEMLGDILGSGRSSRLNQEIREKSELAHSIGAGMFSLQTDGIFAVSAVCDPAKRSAVEKSALELIEQVKEKGVTAIELERARRSLLSDQLRALTTASGKARDLGSNWLLTRNPDFSRHYLAQIATVTQEDIQRVAKEYLREDQLNVTSLNPPSTTRKTDEKITNTIPSDFRIFTLENGLRLLVREDARLPLVSMNASFRSGLLAETADTNGVTRLLSRTLLKGTKSRTGEQIAAEIEGVGGSIGAETSNNTFRVFVEVMQPDTALGIELLADVLINPIFSEREVELEKTAQLAGIKAEQEQPTALARNLLRRSLFGSHPYGLPASGSPEPVAKLTPADLVRVHQKFAVAKNGVIAVVGDVKAEEVFELVKKSFGSLPAGNLAFTEVVAAPPASNVQPVVGHLNKQQAIVMIGFQGSEITSPDHIALELINEASNNLGSRFFNRIREEMGLAYFVGAAQFAGLAPGAFLFYLGTDPAKVEQVTSAFRAEISDLAKNGLTDVELSRAKKRLLGDDAIRNQSNSSVASSASAEELLGLGYGASLLRAAKIQETSADDIRRVAAKYFQDSARVEAIVLPPPTPPTNP